MLTLRGGGPDRSAEYANVLINVEGAQIPVSQEVARWEANAAQEWLREGDLILGNRKHKPSVFMMYNFNDGPLKGLTVGGGYRYHSKAPTNFIAGDVLAFRKSRGEADFVAGYTFRNVPFLKRGFAGAWASLSSSALSRRSVDVKGTVRLECIPSRFVERTVHPGGRPPAWRARGHSPSGQTDGALAIELELVPEHGMWIAARTDAGLAQIAHTTPVYVTVDADGFHNRTNLAAQIDISLGYLQEIRDMIHLPAEQRERKVAHEAPGPWSYPGATERLKQRIADAKIKLEELRGRK